MIPCQLWEFGESLLFDLWWPQADHLGISSYILLFDLWWPQLTQNDDLGNSGETLLFDLWWPHMKILGILGKFAFWPLVTPDGQSLTSGDLTWPLVSTTIRTVVTVCTSHLRGFCRFTSGYLKWPLNSTKNKWILPSNKTNLYTKYKSVSHAYHEIWC